MHTCSAYFIQYASDLICVDLEQLEIPECNAGCYGVSSSLFTYYWKKMPFFFPRLSFTFWLLHMNTWEGVLSVVRIKEAVQRQTGRRYKSIRSKMVDHLPERWTAQRRVQSVKNLPETWVCPTLGPLLAGAVTLQVVWAPTLNRCVTLQI